MVIIHVLAGGDLFQHVLNAMASFMKQDSFLGLLRITALAGIIMATAAYLKTLRGVKKQSQNMIHFIWL